VAGYGLIVHPDAGRAEQYARLVEQADLRATVARTVEEGLFHVRRLGAPAIVLLDISLPGEAEIGFLRTLGEVLRPRAAPVVAIVDSRQTYELVARHMIELNVAALLTRSHNLRTIERAVRATIGAPDPPARSGPVVTAPVARRDAPKPPPPPSEAQDYVSAVRNAGTAPEHPLVAELARRPALENGASDAELQRLAADTASVFRVPMALLWLDRSERTSFAAWPRPQQDAVLRGGGGDWLALRSAMAEEPLHVADAARHRVLSRNKLVADGKVRSYAAAPLRARDGRVVGAIGLADPRAGGIPPDLLDPLAFWALRVGSDLPPLEAEPRPAQTAASLAAADGPPQPGGAKPPPRNRAMEAARGLLAALDTAVLVTTGGAIAYANARALDLLFMGERQLRGMRRSEMLSLLASFTDARPEALRDIASAAMERGPRSFDLSIHAPQRRVLRWQTRRIEVGEHQGLVDEIVDVTKEATATDAREKLVRLDELTQLPNRRAGEEALGRSISWSLRTGGLLSVGLFEIDSLDVFESAIARQVFRATAWLLRDALRGYDLAVRHGPRLLLAILPGIAAAQMSAFGERFRTAVERTRIEGLPPVTVSGGIAQFDGVQDGAQLVAAAAAALEAARARGGNAVV